MERLGAVDLALASRRRAGGAAAARRMAGGVVAARGAAWAWEGAKGRARWRGEVSPGPFGRGRAVDEVHRRRTAGGANRAAGGERDGDKGINVISEIPGTSR